MSTSLSSTPTTTAPDPVPVLVPTSLDELVKLLHAELGSNGLDSEGVDVDRVKALMTNYASNEEDWKKYAHFDKGRYTRNLVDDGNGKFNLMILAWPENVGSAIHDHSGSHCLMKVLDGKLKETLYDWPERIQFESGGHHLDSGLGSDNSDSDDSSCVKSSKTRPMVIKKETILHRDECAYMSDQLGLHRVSNPLKSAGAGSLSLHLYTPPYETCKTFNEKSSIARASGKCVFFSEKGEKLQSCPSAAYLACSLTENDKDQ
ncbi:Cysteine dioxygenase [Linnemannia schmuckeri]|uniref:Cysteine dioxygenase n=1 Tax=Linnemannia schmuckeri TaxID=64567 RepID=A0A9P5V7D8_9FUNG|nr:Cysteine dioxygenase [Linnemannia schmuckeri]